MTALRFALAALVALMVSSPQNSSSAQGLPAPPASCPVTSRPAKAFIPPAPDPSDAGDHGFWLGTEKLWTYIHEPMVWGWKPHSPQLILTEKVFWGRVGYSWRSEPVPKIKVTGRRLDGPAPPLVLPYGRPTHAIMGDEGHAAMLTGVYVPVPGCWKITGDYEGDKLSFVVWVVPIEPGNQ